MEGGGRERGKKGEREGGMEGVGGKGRREREREGGNGESNVLSFLAELFDRLYISLQEKA